MLVRNLFVTFLVLLAAARGDLRAVERWTKIETPNFTLYTLDGEKEARRAAQQFEEAHRFFESLWRKLDREKPIRILSFNDANKAYEQMTLNKRSAAFYLGAADADYIVMRDLSKDSFPIAVHEYMHLVVRHAGLHLPLWLNEGLAEVYSTIEERKKDGRNHVLIGALPAMHLHFLNGTRLFELPRLLGVTQGDKIYSAGDDNTHRFYAQSWALTHMLMLQKDYTPSFNKVLAAAEKAEVTPADLEKVTGKTLAAIDKDLENYIRQAMFRGFLYDTKLKGKEAEVQLAALEPGEDELLLAGLKIYRADWKEHAAALEKAVARHPDSVFAQEMAWALASRMGDRQKETAALGKALELKSASPFAALRYARMTYSDEGALPLTVSSLERALEKYPDHLDVRIELAMALNRAKKPSQGLAVLLPVKQVTPRQASRFFFARAYSLAGSKSYDEAKDAALKAKQYATEEHDARNADGLLRSIETYQAALARNAALAPGRALRETVLEPLAQPEERIDETRPVLRKPEEVPTEDATIPMRLAGATLEEQVAFEAFECETRIFTLRRRDGQMVRLYLEDPKLLEVVGTGTVTVDLTCGPQKHQALKVTYRPQQDAKRRSEGLLRRIEFVGGY
jgi:hypothetical protein